MNSLLVNVRQPPTILHSQLHREYLCRGALQTTYLVLPAFAALEFGDLGDVLIVILGPLSEVGSHLK